MKLAKIVSFAKYGSVATGIIVLLGVTLENAEGKQRKRTKRVSSHGHSHGHGHEEQSPWILGAGVSVSKGVGSSSSGGGEGESGGDHSGHAHLTESEDRFNLDDGHAHDEGGGEAGSEGSSLGVEPSFSALVGYRITSKIAANLGLSFGPTSGIGDPLVGMDFKLPKIGKMKSSVIPSFTIPLSKASADSYKITTFSTTWNPSLKSGKMLYSASTGLAKSYYSKTIIVEEEANFKIPEKNSLSLVQDDHDDEGIVEEGESLDTGDREFDRYSLNTSAGYTLSKNMLTGFGLGVAMVTKQFGPSQVETSATVLKFTYLWKSLATSLSLGLSESSESFAVPKNPNISFGLFYSYE